MDDTTKNMVISLGAGIAKKALIAAGASFATHGIIASNQIETFVSLGFFVLGTAWSLWNDYGRPIVLSQLEVLKAKSLAQAEKMRAAGVTPVTPSQIASQTPSMTTASVTKVIATLPEEIQANVRPVAKVLLLAVVAAGLLMFGGDVRAQTQTQTTRKLNLPIDPLGLNGTPVTGNTSKDLQALWQKIITASNTDLTYASSMAASAGTPASKQRKQCWDAIIAINQQANGLNLKNADGSPMVKPDPHLFSDAESLAEVIDNLSPQGPLFTSCAGAAEMVKMNVLQFVSAVVSGGAGLAALGVP